MNARRKRSDLLPNHDTEMQCEGLGLKDAAIVSVLISLRRAVLFCKDVKRADAFEFSKVKKFLLNLE